MVLGTNALLVSLLSGFEPQFRLSQSRRSQESPVQMAAVVMATSCPSRLCLSSVLLSVSVLLLLSCPTSAQFSSEKNCTASGDPCHEGELSYDQDLYD